jgi:N-formylglutamate deformylase
MNDNDLVPSIIVHVPHSSRVIPDKVRESICLSDDNLCAELDRLTDHFTDELFSVSTPQAVIHRYPVSRYVVDPERFADDITEPMAKRGQGAVYTKTVDGQDLRRKLTADERNCLLDEYYWPHHIKLDQLAQQALDAHGFVLIIDGHSFPSKPLPVDLDQSSNRPDFCIGTDEFHSPPELVKLVKDELMKAGYSVGINSPYRGTLVPNKFFNNDDRVKSIMIEINRQLYLQDEPNNIEKKELEFGQLKKLILKTILKTHKHFH